MKNLFELDTTPFAPTKLVLSEKLEITEDSEGGLKKENLNNQIEKNFAINLTNEYSYSNSESNYFSPRNRFVQPQNGKYNLRSTELIKCKDETKLGNDPLDISFHPNSLEILETDNFTNCKKDEKMVIQHKQINEQKEQISKRKIKNSTPSDIFLDT